ncbi:MAG: TerC/Alx family metal homeostasis membrane protein [Buchnera aphidicola (Chaetogeoica yunlongensis)]
MVDTIGTPILWCSVGVIIIILLVIDFSVQNFFKSEDTSTKLALILSLLWFLITILFSCFIWLYTKFTFNENLASKNFFVFLSGYFLEKSFSMDNMAIWYILFQSFSIPVIFQRKILLYGIFFALILRSILIFCGIWLLSNWSFIFYILGIFLFFTGVKIIFLDSNGDKQNTQDIFFVKWIYRNFRLTKNFSGNKFFSREKGVLVATPLFLVLILVELNDIILSLDSIPAIFSITKDPFIVMTSSFFSMAGLRSVYIILVNELQNISFIKYGIAVILIFISIKILLKELFEIPISVSLAFIMITLISCFIAGKIFVKVKI